MTESRPVCAIVGAGDYIGAAIARKFASEGFAVCGCRRNGEKLTPLIEELNTQGHQAWGYAMDARDEDQVKSWFATIEQDIGPIEVCVFNVGGNVNFPICDTTQRVFYKVWQMACLAGFLTGREAATHMLKRNRGSIFFTGATASLRGGDGFAAFASAKFGLRALAQSMARELGPQNIHVAHLIIDAGVDTAWVRERMAERGIKTDDLPQDSLMNPDSVANAYWNLHNQSRDAWSHEMDLRPSIEKW